ncbi:MAG TPA: hypothetical protein VEL31_21410 [Ktedonobacteraceae bacterium]|nr:hypothetical protein [Ktedonobacteraceae bacterium]
MDPWDEVSVAEFEQVPAWMVPFAHLWTQELASGSAREYTRWRKRAQQTHTPLFVLVLRNLRDTYGITPTTTPDPTECATRWQQTSKRRKITWSRLRKG